VRHVLELVKNTPTTGQAKIVLSAVEQENEMKIEILDKGHVQYMDHMGSDLTVVNAARVSFDKESEWDWIHGTKTVHEPCDQGHFGTSYERITRTKKLSDRDTKLINYLAKHNHWTPFGQCNLQLRIKMPIFVARQMMRSNIGIVWNEVSRRYVDNPPEAYMSDVWRSRPTGGMKQGSGSEEIQVDESDEKHLELMLGYYNTMIADGIAPEQARAFLPQSTYTEVVGNFTLAALARVCALRIDPHAQWEIQEYARAMSEIAEQYFPVSWKALSGGEG
jgi:thymidylate synthase (FAD)